MPTYVCHSSEEVMVTEISSHSCFSSRKSDVILPVPANLYFIPRFRILVLKLVTDKASYPHFDLYPMMPGTTSNIPSKPPSLGVPPLNNAIGTGSLPPVSLVAGYPNIEICD